MSTLLSVTSINTDGLTIKLLLIVFRKEFQFKMLEIS